jgi:hypothetical protein
LENYDHNPLPTNQLASASAANPITIAVAHAILMAKKFARLNWGIDNNVLRVVVILTVSDTMLNEGIDMIEATLHVIAH